LITDRSSICIILLCTIHRMETPGQAPMILIEVQIRVDLGKDDIAMYEDISS